jgi:hypothetical protein
MLSGNIDEEMQIATKEILDHLRAAQDYSARQVWQIISPRRQRRQRTFPSRARGWRKTER